MIPCKRTLIAAGSASALFALAGPAVAGPNVVASIPPVHSIVAGVMAGLGEPTLLVAGGASPHSYALRPSEARALDEADLVFWVGESMETFLHEPLESIAAGATVIEFAEAPGITLLPMREGGVFDAHEHDHDDDHDDATGEAAHHDHHADEGEHDDGPFDGHIWLSMGNTAWMIDAVVGALGAHDPANAAIYAANGAAVRARLDELADTLSAQLAPLHDRPFVVFHDAYQYFEQEHDLHIAGSITIDPEQRPGARRLTELRDRIADVGAACVFSEPQFPSDLVQTIAEGTPAKTAVLDPLGASLTPGPDLYFALMEGMGAAFATCLAKTG